MLGFAAATLGRGGAAGSVAITTTSATLDFKNGTYVSGGVSSALGAIPGYGYVRSGAKAELSGSASAVTFAADTPGIIVGVGYQSRAALTGLTLQSQSFDSGNWIKDNCTVAANNATAPDGSSSADTLTVTGPLAQVYQGYNGAAGTYTTSIFLPAGGTAPFAYLQVNTSVGVQFVAINRTTGAVGAVQLLAGSALTMTAYSVAVGTGWRLVLVWVETATSYYVVAGLCDSATSRTSTVGITAPLWQHQTIAGNYPDGGPIIVTTSAPVTVGADVMTVGLVNGSYTATFTFDDLSTQSVSITATASSITLPVHPTVLNRSLVQKVVIA